MEMIVATMPARTIASRKNAGSLNRREPSTARPYSVSGGRILARRCRADLVAHAPHRDDRRRIAELAAQLPHVNIDRPRVAREGVAPDALEQLIAREHETAVVEQLPEKVELLRRELDLLVADLRLAPAGVDGELAMADDGALAIRRRRRRAAQNRAN